MLQRKEFAAGEFDTGFIEREFKSATPVPDEELERVALITAVIAAHERSTAPAAAEAGNGKPAVSAWKLAGRGGS